MTVLDILKERKQAQEKEKSLREEAEDEISSILREDDFSVNSVDVVSSYYEFSVIMDHAIGADALDELDKVFLNFTVSAVHAVVHEDSPRLRVHFKEDDDGS